MPFDQYWGVFTEDFVSEKPEFTVGSIVNTNAPHGSWWKYGKVISMNMMTKTAQVQHSNGEIGTYGFRQLHKTKYKKLPY